MILTGAGVSADSGVRTFRDSGGLWENHRVEDVATPAGFAADPVLVWTFYSHRRRQAAQAEPNAAHRAIADLFVAGRAGGFRVTLITQNVDTLHEAAQRAAGNPEPIVAMHGTLSQSLCHGCGQRWRDTNIYFAADGRPTAEDAPGLTCLDPALAAIPATVKRSPSGIPLSPCCDAWLRPDIVWFGEVPYRLRECEEALVNCDLFIGIGTSGNVYPAAGFVRLARRCGARTVCINREPPENAAGFDEHLLGAAAAVVPEFLRLIPG